MRFLALLAAASMAVIPLAASATSSGTTVGATVNGEETCNIRTVSNLNFGPYDPVNVNGPGASGVDDLATGQIAVLCTNQASYKLSPASGSSTLSATNAPSLTYFFSLNPGPFKSVGTEVVYPIAGVLKKGQPAQNLAYTDAGFVITVSLTSSV